ncbi:chymotrypsin-1-like [Atheta coriaria]|uniref:chymotrypsin-1-like n=1 Tax=Dalotia coriaria TaxID=877792 RepID=UPI0031F3AE83
MKVVIILACVAATVFAAPGNNGSWRIVGGDGDAGTAPHTSPYQVSLSINGAHTCSGSILDDSTILTAAHCVVGFCDEGSDPTLIKIAAGKNKLSELVYNNKGKSVICHEDYDSWDIKNDIAIIKLETALTLTADIQAVQLPRTDIINEEVTFYGWGTTDNSSILSDALKYITMKTISVKDCIDKMPDKVGPTEVCAIAGTGKGACHGDAGGPLLASDGTVIGIVSWGIPCAEGYPDVFTRVYSFLDWIEENRN